MTFSLITSTADRLGLTAFALANSPRAMRILRHYTSQIERERMDPVSALERCVGDICGNGNFKGIPDKKPAHAPRTEAIL